MLLLLTITLALAGLALALYFIIAYAAIIFMFVTVYGSCSVVIIRSKEIKQEKLDEHKLVSG